MVWNQSNSWSQKRLPKLKLALVFLVWKWKPAEFKTKARNGFRIARVKCRHAAIWNISMWKFSSSLLPFFIEPMENICQKSMYPGFWREGNYFFWPQALSSWFRWFLVQLVDVSKVWAAIRATSSGVYPRSDYLSASLHSIGYSRSKKATKTKKVQQRRIYRTMVNLRVATLWFLGWSLILTEIWVWAENVRRAPFKQKVSDKLKCADFPLKTDARFELVKQGTSCNHLPVKCAFGSF